MAYFADDFNRTSPAGPGDSTAGTPDYELGANWTSWTSDGDRGAVIHADALSQYQEWNFHGWAAPDDAAATDDIAVRLTVDTSITSFHIALRSSDAAIAEGSSGGAGGPHLDDHATGGVVFRVQMQFGTPGQVTMMVDSAYQGPTDITGSTRYDDGLPHTYEARVVGDTASLYIDGALKFTRSDMGTLPTGSTRRRVAVGWPGDGDQQHVDNWESGDHPLTGEAAAGLTSDPTELAAFFIRNQRQLHLWEGSPGAEPVGTNAPAEHAAAIGAADSATVTIGPSASHASATGDALDATVSTGTFAPAGHAAGTGTASAATARIAPAAGQASASGAASGATPTISPAAGHAAATGAASQATAKNSPTAGSATGTGQAHDATVATGSFTNAPAGHAAGTGTASAATVRISLSAGLAAGVAIAHAAIATIKPAAGNASAVGAAHQPTATTANGGTIIGGTGSGSVVWRDGGSGTVAARDGRLATVGAAHTGTGTVTQ